MQESPYKGKTGITRIVNAFKYSWDGLQAAYRNENAFRQEIVLGAVLLPMAFLLESRMFERSLMIGCILLVIITELLNSAIEAAVDRVSLDHHNLAKRAKDMGSAAVLVSLVNLFVVWLLLLLD